MSYSMKSERGIVWVRHTGELRVDEAKTARKETGILVAEHGVHKVLVDLREATLSQTTMDLYDFGSSYGDVFPQDTRVAVVYSPEKTSSSDDAEFAENVARNRGALVRMFTEMGEAIDWLSGL